MGIDVVPTLKPVQERDDAGQRPAESTPTAMAAKIHSVR